MAKQSQAQSQGFERVYIVPLRREFLKVPKYKRAKKAVTALKEFLKKHVKKDVKIKKELNEYLWSKGIKNPPHKVKIKVFEEKNILYANLFTVKEKEKKEKAKITEKVKKYEEKLKKEAEATEEKTEQETKKEELEGGNDEIKKEEQKKEKEKSQENIKSESSQEDKKEKEEETQKEKKKNIK